MAYQDENFIDKSKMVWNYSIFTQADVHRFQKGEMHDAYLFFGSRPFEIDEVKGIYFAVWAPNADLVNIIGDFNGWKLNIHKMYVRHDSSGIWEGFIPYLSDGTKYKYHIVNKDGGVVFKADPYAYYAELRPGTASITRDITYGWKDDSWMKARKNKNALSAPWSVYELHLASWMRPVKNDENAYTSYLDLIPRLVPYVVNMGFSHVEFMPVMEHPYDGSWGYQGAGFFAATSRFGNPQEFMQLIEALHQNNVGVILDWVPSHFPSDAHGLYLFDGTHTYEYADMRKGFHVDWNSYIFNYKRGEVISFLISSAHFWCKVYHIDGLRVDAVNSIIRLDFSRKEGEWEPNELGGNENLEATAFLKKMNTIIYRDFPDVQTIAEEASDWPGITTPVSEGGLGFGMKWMMGWMHDSFRYFKKVPEARPDFQNDLSFSMMYFYDENFMLPLSHDEVVHGKSPMIYKMPGNEWEKFANLRLLYSWMFLHPGAKLLFMGNEFGQTSEWNYESELDWELLAHAPHHGLQRCVKALNALYQSEKALYELQFEPSGFEWIDINHRSEGILVFRRKGKSAAADMVVVMNVTKIPQECWQLHIKGKTAWKEVFNSDDSSFFGSGNFTNTNMAAVLINKKEKLYEINMKIPALGLVVIK